MSDPRSILESLDYGPAPESDEDARSWIARWGDAMPLFIDGAFETPAGRETFPTRNPATGETLTSITQATESDVDRAVAAARRAAPLWWDLGPAARSRHLYALSRGIQKNSRLFATLETLDNGKPIRETRDIDVPLVARHFHHHAGWARLLDETLPGSKPWGVCGQVIPWNFPLLMLSWKVAPALAAGNTVVLKPAEWTSLTALLFAELCEQVGLPPGVVNVVTGDGRCGAAVSGHGDVDKVAFTGSTEVGRIIRRQIAGSGKGLTLELGGKSPFIVFDDADLDSAVEGLVDAIWFNQGQVCCAGSRLLVAESIAEAFHRKVIARMEKLRIGSPLDKAVDLGAMVEEEHLVRVRDLCETAVAEGHSCVQSPQPLPEAGYWFPPTLFPNISPAASIAQEEVFGPVLVSMTFRSPAEAVRLANHTRYGLAASVWSQDIDTALDVSRQLHAGTVWVNCTNLFDAAAGFGGVRESGYGREGGLEGLHAYLQPATPWEDETECGPAGGTLTEVGRDALVGEGLDRTAKLFIGGKQARPDGGYSLEVRGPDGAVVGEVGRGNRKDIRNAVEAANAAREWGGKSAHLRSQILWYLAENLGPRADELAGRITAMTGVAREAAAEEVATAIDRLTWWAAWSDKYDGRIHEVPIRGLVLALHEPIGVVGVVATERHPLLGLVSLVAPLVATGNTVVSVPSESSPLAATDLYQVLDTSDVPAGVWNIVTGRHEEIVPSLAEHDAVDALWYAGAAAGVGDIERASAGNLKRTWCPAGFDPRSPRALGEELLRQSTRVKNVWLPHGV